MTTYHAITRTRHGSKRWLRSTSYAFAINDGLLPLGLGEIAKASLTLPLAFIQQDDRFVPVSVMSLQPKRNHYVSFDGRWLQAYIPAHSRSYPFSLHLPPEGPPILCIDEDSGLVTDGPDGEAFFNDTGEPTPQVLEILKFLQLNNQSLKAAAQAAAVLQQHQLIVPWEIAIKTDDGEHKVAGLHKIDESALNVLAGDVLVELRNCGALILAYCQLISMQHLPFLGELAKAHAQAEQAAAAAAKKIETNGELNLEFLNSGDSLNFGGFR